MKASVMRGELSVRMVVPMDMKKLVVSVPSHRYLHYSFDFLPKGCCGTEHVLSECSHHSLRSWSESDDVGRAEDEADDESDS